MKSLLGEEIARHEEIDERKVSPVRAVRAPAFHLISLFAAGSPLA